MRTHLTILLAFLWNDSLSAAEPTYWQDVRPILRKHCTVCHSARHLSDLDVSAGLALDTLAAIRQGGQGGKVPIIREKHGAKSLLVTILSDKDPKRRMPLDADPLSDDKIAVITRWIDAGMPEGQPPVEVATVPSVPAKQKKLAVTIPTLLAAPRTLDPTFPPNSRLEVTLPVGPLPGTTAVAYSPDGRYLAVGSYGSAIIWDLSTASPVKGLTNVLGAVNDLRFSPDGKLLAVAGGQPSARGEVRLFSVGDWRLLSTLGGHLDSVSSVSFRPDGKIIASASFDKTARIWDVSAAKVLATVTAHSDFVHAVAFSPDGKRLATASKDRTVRVSDPTSGKPLLTLSGLDQDVLTVAFSPDGRSIVSSGFESQLYWWDAATGERTKRMAGHDVAVHELQFSKDGKLVVSAGADKTARLWSGETGNSVRTHQVGSVVNAVAIRPDGKQFATGSFDGLVRLWDTSNGRSSAILLAAPAGDALDWLTVTPEGYTDGSEPWLKQAMWSAGGKPVPAERIWPHLRQSAEIRKAVHDNAKLTEPRFTGK